MSRSPAAVEPFPHFLARLEAVPADPGDKGPAAHPPAETPPWLTQVVAALFEGQEPAVSKDWARRVHGELERLGGQVPFTVVHDWHARVVVPMLAEASARDGADTGPQRAVRLLHAKALAGERIEEARWTAALGPVVRDAYRLAYAYADAFATAYAGAHAYATANGFDESAAVEYADTYATMNTGANVESYADANALANAKAMARAYASGDARAYAGTYPFAQVRVCAHAHADQRQAAGRSERRRAAYERLADGLAESLARAAA
ncbi:SpcZ [Streptomyces sp. AK02-01A]|uniref:SpcZ n=1 Tax=Streptomyces sp. AK02-01A TaxID=3028648 RepID=UPI0029B2429B|nr:SpcZ [Streptomyces sp. AK02-01A]MDX3854766.1 SpcZ [Streptomyces sp. AK02-01A]